MLLRVNQSGVLGEKQKRFPSCKWPMSNFLKSLSASPSYTQKGFFPMAWNETLWVWMFEFEGHVATRHCAVFGVEPTASSKHCFLILSQCRFGTIFTLNFNFHLHALIFRNPEILLNWRKKCKHPTSSGVHQSKFHFYPVFPVIFPCLNTNKILFYQTRYFKKEIEKNFWKQNPII